jgi:uncharacterized membrane protein (UPF0127 family)
MLQHVNVRRKLISFLVVQIKGLIEEVAFLKRKENVNGILKNAYVKSLKVIFLAMDARITSIK